jgi:hypothetical protein
VQARRSTDAAPLQAHSAPPASPAPRHVAIEEWFLRRGMPTVMGAPPSLPRLLLRAVPALVGYMGIFLALTISEVALREIDPEVYRTFSHPDTVLPRWYLIAIATGIALAFLAGILANWRIRRRPPGDRAALILTATVPLLLILLPFVDTVIGASDSPWGDVVVNAVVIGVTLLLVRSGLGAIFVWSVRQALAQGSALTSLAARALPMIVLVTLFAFLSEGMWRVSGALSRGELWQVVTILLGIAAVFIWTVIHGEMRQLMEHPRCSPEEMRAQGFPADATGLAPATSERPARLTKREAANARVILFIALAIQVGSLVILVFIFFCVFGAITVPASVIEVWTGHAPTTGTLMGVRLPVRHELIQTSLFLAAFSAVSFAASSVTDPIYRQNFFEPILRDMRVTIAARNLYRASIPAGTAERPVETADVVPASPAASGSTVSANHP